MIRKYPRTRHIAGSRLQPGDEDLDQVPFHCLLDCHIVVEEKMDGANCALSFGPDADLRLQSRGHFLTGGPRERQFDLFKQWARTLQDPLFDALTDRYVLYGEWLYAKHTVFYDRLPHYFMEFDVLDVQTNSFLDTPRRAELLRGLPIQPVKVLFEGRIRDEAHLWSMIGRSHFISDAPQPALDLASARLGLDPEEVARQTDLSGSMEGLYIKVESEGVVRDRLKIVRRDFTSRILSSESHWNDRPLVPNALRPNTQLFSSTSVLT